MNFTPFDYRILIIGSSRSSKTNVLLNLIQHHQPDIDKIYLYIKDLVQSKFNQISRLENLKKATLWPLFMDEVQLP